MTDIRNQAFKIYHPPFKYVYGYIYDSKNNVVSDDKDKCYDRAVISRVRGWGKISYLPDAEALQDEIGIMIAEALTEYWSNHA